MTFLPFRRVWVFVPVLSLAGIIACSSKDNPDEIRQRTADATQTMRRDAKAVAEGVKEGMSSDKAVNINEASRAELLNLPGMTERDADRIVAERPFKNANDLLARHVLSRAEYDRIKERVTVDH
jgi:DNA uptake protein ComE-like DNA-binding protein